MHLRHSIWLIFLLFWIPVDLSGAALQEPAATTKTVRVFIFAGQSNMVGADSKVKDINRFPPFAGLDQPQDKVLFSYNIGREEKRASQGWITLQPIGDLVGPELSFAQRVTRETGEPIAIIKCAAGGTTLGGDWNPDEPQGFKLYPEALNLIRNSLAELEQKGIPYRLEGFMWHQGENDMFSKEFKPNYGRNLKNFIQSWRRDLNAPDLRFFIGELCAKTIWGMDNRDNMYAIREGQREVCEADPLVDYVPTSHDAVEIGGAEGLHYHYGTLGQLEHGVNYANAYLQTLGKGGAAPRTLQEWPYAPKSPIKLFVLAGHRNMEGERGFKQELTQAQEFASLAEDNHSIAYKYNLGGGFKVSKGWEPLGPSGFYDTFGPELSFATSLKRRLTGNIAIAKFTHSGSQVNDWTPEGTSTPQRNVYPEFIAFIREAIDELKAQGHSVELAGIFYHCGENDTAFGPYRRNVAKWLQSTVAQSRRDLEIPNLKWYISQQQPAESAGLDSIDVTADLSGLDASDPDLIHIRAFELPGPDEKLVISTPGLIRLGEYLAEAYLETSR